MKLSKVLLTVIQLLNGIQKTGIANSFQHGRTYKVRCRCPRKQSDVTADGLLESINRHQLTALLCAYQRLSVQFPQYNGFSCPIFTK